MKGLIDRQTQGPEQNIEPQVIKVLFKLKLGFIWRDSCIEFFSEVVQKLWFGRSPWLDLETQKDMKVKSI